MSSNHKLEKLSLPELMNRFLGEAPDGERYAFTYYQEIADLILRQGAEGEGFLREEMKTADPVRLRAILFALTSAPKDAPGLEGLLLNYLIHPDPLVVAEAIDGLAKREAKSNLGRVRNLLGHSSPYVRGAVLRFIRAVDASHALPVLLKALQDENFIVRENAADELGELRNVSVIPQLRLAERDPHPDVREAARTAIEILESIPPADERTKSE